MRIGIFYDGFWWADVSRALARRYDTPFLSFAGIHDAFRWWISQTQDIPLVECVVAEKHFVRGRDDEELGSAFERVLVEYDIRRHDAQMAGIREKGADVLFALTTFEAAIEEELDLAILMTGDADFVPLVAKLKQWDVSSLVPDVQLPGSRVASRLLKVAAFTPSLETVLDEANSPDYPLASLRGRRLFP